MKKKLIFCICLILCVVISASVIPFSAYVVKCPVKVTSRAALVVNLETDTAVYEKNSDGIRYLSYLANIMTFLVTKNNVADLDTKITIKPEVLYAIENPDNTLDKYANKKLSIRDLLYYIIMTDGKDACYVLADYVANGDIEAFVGLMNKKAKELGCEKTVFVQPSIVQERNQYTSCKDMYKIIKYALSIPEYVEISSTVNYIPGGSDNKKLNITTTNSLLKLTSPYYFKHVKNGKYAADSVARGNIVAVSEYRDVHYLCVVMGAEVKSEHNAFTEVSQLLSWAYQSLGNKQVISQSTVLSTVEADTAWGQVNVNLTAGKDVVYTMPAEYDANLLSYKVDEGYTAQLPVFKGQNMGIAKVYYDDKFLDEIDLIADSSVGISMLSDLSGFAESMLNSTFADGSNTAQTETQAPTLGETKATDSTNTTETQTSTQAGQ